MSHLNWFTMKTLMTLLVLLASGRVAADDTSRISSRVSDVTVYLIGAQITRKAEVKLKKGRQLLLFEGLSRQADAQSVQVEAIAGCRLLTVKHAAHEEPAGRKGALERSLEKKIESFEDRVREIGNETDVFRIEEKMLLDNSAPGSENATINVGSIRQAADFYRQRLNDIRREQLRLAKEKRALADSIRDTYSRINQAAARRTTPSSQLLIEIESDRTAATTLKFSYYVSSAGWKPVYDFRVDEITTPMIISYNAEVFQSTGEDWEKVRLRLSSYNPSARLELPALLPWYLDRPGPKRNMVSPAEAQAVRGSLSDANTGETIPFANVVLYRGTEQMAVATTNIDGEFVIKPVYPGQYTLKGVYIGYDPAVSTVEVEKKGAAFQAMRLRPNNTALQEVEVANYQQPLLDPDMKSGRTVTREEFSHLATKDINSRGGRGGTTTHFVNAVSVDVETVYLADDPAKYFLNSTEYDIDLPYSIPSDGVDHTIRVKETTTGASYVYHAIPKLETDVFLYAEIPAWHDLHLLSGKVNVFFQGTFTGQTFVNAMQTDDTLKINLGRDRGVIVSRTGRRQVNDKNSFSSTVRENMEWTIVARNNKNSPIRLVVKDQYPLAERKSIETELVAAGGAAFNEKTGEMRWEFTLDPGNKKSIGYSYSFKYPKWSRIVTD